MFFQTFRLFGTTEGEISSESELPPSDVPIPSSTEHFLCCGGV